MKPSVSAENTQSLDCFALQLKTKQGNLLGVGGICYEDQVEYWKERLLVLLELQVNASDIVQIDRKLAEALTSLADESLLLAGITFRVKDLELPDGVRTGGVIGCPKEPAQSADGEAEELPEGFAQYAMPGGPGLAALAPKEVVEKTLKKLSAVGTGTLWDDVRENLQVGQQEERQQDLQEGLLEGLKKERREVQKPLQKDSRGELQKERPEGQPGELQKDQSEDRTEELQEERPEDRLGEQQERKILRILRSAGLGTGLLVYDGTGSQAPGYLLAFTENHWRGVWLDNLER